MFAPELQKNSYGYQAYSVLSWSSRDIAAMLFFYLVVVVFLSSSLYFDMMILMPPLGLGTGPQLSRPIG